MDKEKLLQELSIKIHSGEISREEVMGWLNFSAPTAQQEKKKEETKKFHFSTTKMLYVLGAAIITIGIIIFVAQSWDDMGPISHIGITLGLGLLMAAIGSILLKQKPEENIGAIFHFIGGILIPGGAVITLYELGVDFIHL